MLALVFFQGHVEIGPAKAKGTDSGPAGIVGRFYPWADLGIQIERAFLDLEFWIGRIDMDGGW